MKSIEIQKASKVKPVVQKKRPKAAEVVASELRRQILINTLKPGDKLHSENVLQGKFSISRPTLREALRMLESESLITITRGKHGGARVSAIDLSYASKQVGFFLQAEQTTLEDVWFARTVLEPPAAALIASRGTPEAFAAMEKNLNDEKLALGMDLLRYADLSAEFSLLITKHCGNKTLHLLASLIYDVIKRQHEHIAIRTLSKSNVNDLRLESIKTRVKALELMRAGKAKEVEKFWLQHLLKMQSLILSAYKGAQTIDVLNNLSLGLKPVKNVRKQTAPTSKTDS